MILDNNLIAYEYYKNQYVPQEIYPSGEKEETKLIDKYTNIKYTSPVLTLKDDIVNSKGYGLKKGFYSVRPDEYLDFLLIYEGNKLKAKVPVVEMKTYPSINPEQKKIKKMSYSKYKHEQIKEYRKYLKGENPAELNWSEVKIHYIADKNAYILIYNSNNIELIGIIKF